MDIKKEKRRKIIIGGITLVGQLGVVYILCNVAPRNVSPFGKICCYVAAVALGNASGPVIEKEILRYEQIITDFGENRNMVIF